MTPDTDQEVEIDKATSTTSGGYLGGHVTGRGKTLIAVESALRVWAERVLIVAPPGTFGIINERAGKADGWVGTVHRQSQGEVVLERASNRNKAEKESLRKLLNGDKGWYFLSREMFQRLDWELQVQLAPNGEPIPNEKTGKPVKKAKQHKIWRKHPFDVLIYDEVQMVADRKGRSFKTFRDSKANLKMGLSADWFGAKLTGMWAPAFCLWPNDVTTNFLQFCDTYLLSEYDHFAFNKKKYTAGEVEPGLFVSTLPAYGRLESTLGVMPEADVRWVDLYPVQRRMYDEIVDDMVTWIEENPLVVELDVTMRIRLRQLALGEFFLREDGVVDFKPGGKSSKYDELKEVIDETGGRPHVIFTDSQKFAENVAARLPGAVSYTGQQSHAERAIRKEKFISGEATHLVCTTQAAGIGLDGLQHRSRDVTILSEVEGMDYLTQQAIGRVWRQGQKNPVNIVKIMANDTYDLDVLDTLIEQALQNNAAKKGR